MGENSRILITTDILDVTDADQFLRKSEGGAVCLFTGTTRRHTGDRVTEELSYDAAEELATAEMRRLAELARSKWPILRLVLAHRLGVVQVGEASVIVGVATPHRAESFEACRFLIDTLKKQVPIWKKERFVDGTQEWVEGTTPSS